MKQHLMAVLLAASAFLNFACSESGSEGVTAHSHGLNLANMLDSPKEGEWGTKVQADYFPTIHAAGFRLIRVPIRWSSHVGPAPDFTIDPEFLARIDWVVAEAEAMELTVILDYHYDDELMKDPDANANRFLATWKQISTHYKDAPASVVFELLNEPNGKLDAEHWNALQTRTISLVRTTNPTRTLVVGPTSWNSLYALDKLVLPESDQHLLVTFHFYDPMSFTHQGASWVEGSDSWLGNKWGSDADKKAVKDAFDTAAKWGADHHRPLYLGEFGAYSKSPIELRADWTACVARAAESHDIPWTYWEFCAGFGAYDLGAKEWRKPLLQALIP